MGLDVYSPKSKNSYHASYGMLHSLRYAAYLLCDGKKTFSEWMVSQDKEVFDWSAMLSAGRFPNLLFHSDAEGAYTMKGTIDWEGEFLMTGNLPGLFQELRIIRKAIKKHDGRIAGKVSLIHFYDLYNVTRDAFKKKSKLIFS